MQWLKKTTAAIVALEKWTLVIMLSVMILLSFLQVVLRQGVSTGIFWADVLLRHLVLAVGFLGAAIATAQDKHFAIDVVKKLIAEKARAWVSLILNLCSIAVLWHLSCAALSFFRDEKEAGSVLFTIGHLEVPSFWINSMIPAGFILLLIHFTLKALEDLVFIKSNLKVSPVSQ